MVPDLILKRSRSKNQETTIVVSKAVSKKAVDRNRIKRMIKEALRELNLDPGHAIIVKTNIANLKTRQVKEKLEKVIKSK